MLKLIEMVRLIFSNAVASFTFLVAANIVVTIFSLCVWICC